MKCSKCNAEWTPGNSKSQLSTCPFCGASLISTVAMDENQTMTSVMVQIVERFGEDILSQESRCLAAFKDFAPKLEKEQKILKIAFGEGVYNLFLNCPVVEREAHMQKARQTMSVLLSDEASLLVINSFANALGWSVGSIEQEHGGLDEKASRTAPDKGSESRASCFTSRNNQDTTNDYRKADEAFKLGEKYFYAHDYGEALKFYRKAADAGNVDAMNNIGGLYHYGFGVLKDYGEAMKWYRKAADAGNADAMYHIGCLYQNGNGVAQDYGEAMKWYRKAADAGDVDAMNNIGELYHYGFGVLKDYGEAMKWYRKAVDAGNADAMYHIGVLYHYSDGVTQDYNEAVKWYRRAADAGHLGAEDALQKIQREQNGCFITTAVCGSFGKSDDCYELTKFRAFRDEWLQKQADGERLIREYYAVAPAIVQRIDSLPNAKAIYHDILEMYLKPCLHMIEQKDMEGCKKMYMKMVYEVGKAISGNSKMS